MGTFLNSLGRRFTTVLFGGAVLLTSLLPVEGADELEDWRPARVPALSLPNLDGAATEIGEDDGKVVLVHFFATWCEPCHDELISLERLAASLDGRPFRILAVDVGEPADRVRRFLERNGMSLRFPILVDFDKSAMRAWGVEMLPSTYALDRALCPLWKVSGAIEWDRAPVLRALGDAIAKPAPEGANKNGATCISKGGER